MSSYCHKPFTSIYFGENNGKVDIKPCCLYQSTQQYSTVTAWLESAELTSLQHHLLTQPTLPQGCRRCHHDETLGLPSLRNKHLGTYATQSVTSIVDLEIFPSNACNLSCLFCLPHISSSVAQEYKKIGWANSVYTVDNTDQALETIQSTDTCRSISIIGGEFFVIKNALDILQAAIEKNLQVKLVTNATCLTANHLSKLQKITDLDITVSIDGTGPTYEFIRWPADWTTVHNNVISLRQALPQAKLQVNTVLHPLIMQNLVDVFEWCNLMHLPMTITNLQRPGWLSWAILQPNEKQMLIQQIQQDLIAHRLTKHQQKILANSVQTLQQAQTDMTLRTEFVTRINTLVSHRSIDQNKVSQVFGMLTDLCSEVLAPPERFERPTPGFVDQCSKSN